MPRPIGRPVQRVDVLDFLEQRLQQDAVFPSVKPHLEAARREFGGGECYVHKNQTIAKGQKDVS